MTAISSFRRLIRPIFQRIQLMVSQGIIRLTYDEAGKPQRMQLSLLAGEVADKVERVQEYGFCSNPPDGSKAISVFLQGNRDHPFVIATDNQKYRIINAKGESALYGKGGQYVKMRNDADVEASCENLEVTASTKATVEAPEIKLGAAALKAVALEADPVYTAPAGGGSLVGYVFTQGRVKVKSE